MGTKTTTLRKEGASRTDLHYIEPQKIVVAWDENPRVDYGTEEEMEFLINSITNEGVKVPVKVYSKDGKLHLAHGFRRMKATLEAISRGANIEKIPAQQVANNIESILLDHITLNSGKPMTMVEQSETIIKLIKVSGMTQAEVSKRVGLYPSQVSLLVSFGEKASTKLKKTVQSGGISFSNATTLIRETEGIEEQNKALDRALDIANKEREILGGKKKKKASLTAVKKATGNQKLTPFERLVQVADSVQGTEFGDKLNQTIRMVRSRMSVEEIVSQLELTEEIKE